jgi:hypothetical protein
MSACLVFVFAGLLEYALVNVIARKGELRQQVRFSKEVSYLLNMYFYFSICIINAKFLYDVFFLIIFTFIEKSFGQTTEINFNTKTTEWLDFYC